MLDVVSPSRPLRAIGLMSGTSLDGIDAAFLVTDGERVLETGPALTVPYDEAFRDRLRARLGRRPDGSPEAQAVARELTLRHVEAVRALAIDDVDVVGFHGHTVFHDPAAGVTCQIGEADLLAERLGVPVVSDLRAADVAAGGEGAPMVPAYHRALAGRLDRPLAVLNVGGVANVTWIGHGDDDLLAFDTGPGNALLDDWARRVAGRPMDADGRLAFAGAPQALVLSDLFDHAHFRRRPPKSLDRDAFATTLETLSRLSPEDGAATLVGFTVGAVALAVEAFPAPVARWLVSGGGRRNPALMAGLRSELEARVDPVEAVGWDGDALEAQAFAFLAVRTLRGLPLTYPGTTGVARPVPGGVVTVPTAPAS